MVLPKRESSSGWCEGDGDTETGNGACCSACAPHSQRADRLQRAPADASRTRRLVLCPSRGVQHQPLATALRLSTAERDHLFRIAGVAPPSRQVVPRHVTPGVQRMVDRLGDVPLAVFTAAHDIVLWNDLWAAVNGDPSRWTGLEGNLVWRHFTHGHDGTDWDDEHQEEFSSDLVADLRQATGRYPADRELAALVERLRRESPEFERRWDTGRVAEHRASRKRVHTPVGPIEVDCDVLTVPGEDLRIVVYTAVPGSEDAWV